MPKIEEQATLGGSYRNNLSASLGFLKIDSYFLGMLFISLFYWEKFSMHRLEILHSFEED